MTAKCDSLRGWLFVVEMNEPGEMEELLSPEQYDSYLESG